MKIISSINCLLLLVVGAQAREVEVPTTLEDYDGPKGRDALAAAVQKVIDAKITPPQTSFLGGAFNSAKYFLGFDCDDYTYKLEGAMTIFLADQAGVSITQEDIDTAVGQLKQAIEDDQADLGPLIVADTWSATITDLTSEGIRDINDMPFDDDFFSDGFVKNVQFDVDITLQMDGAHFFSEMEMNEVFVQGFGPFVTFLMFELYPSDPIWGLQYDLAIYSCQERDDICLQNTR